MIVVTGSTGTVGSRLVDLLLEERHNVRVFSRGADKAGARFGDRVDVAVGDFGDPASVRAALAGADRVFLLTASAPEPDLQLQHERNVIAAANEAAVRHIVKLSVLGADERSPMRYARGHREAEKDLEASGLDYTILRAEAFMQGLFESASSGSIFTCAEDGKVAMVDAGDIAAVAVAVLTGAGHEGMTYTITGPDAVSYDEAATTLTEATGNEHRHVRVPPARLIEEMRSAGVPQWLAEDLAAQFGVFAAGGGAPPSGDVAAITGRPPRALAEVASDEYAAHLAPRPSGAQLPTDTGAAT